MLISRFYETAMLLMKYVFMLHTQASAAFCDLDIYVYVYVYVSIDIVLMLASSALLDTIPIRQEQGIHF